MSFHDHAGQFKCTASNITKQYRMAFEAHIVLDFSCVHNGALYCIADEGSRISYKTTKAMTVYRALGKVAENMYLVYY